jgi:Zn-finger nucleic acid-binding protein
MCDLRKEGGMGRTLLNRKKKLVCPACNAPVHFQAQEDDLGTCPRCGEWLVQRGRWNRRLERLDYEPDTDFDESPDWERSLVDEIE